MKTLLTGLLFLSANLGLMAVAYLLNRWNQRRAAKAVVLQAETVTYLAALARLQREEESR